MGSDNWMCVGRVKPRDITPQAPTNCTYPIPLLEVFGPGISPEDIELGPCEDVDRNYRLFSWLGESRGSSPPFQNLTDEQEERIEEALRLLPFTEDICDSNRSYRDGQHDKPKSNLYYIGWRHKRVLPLDLLLSFDLDAVAYTSIHSNGVCYVTDPEGKTWRECFGEEGHEFFEQAKALRAEGWQFFIYGFTG